MFWHTQCHRYHRVDQFLNRQWFPAHIRQFHINRIIRRKVIHPPVQLNRLKTVWAHRWLLTASRMYRARYQWTATVTTITTFCQRVITRATMIHNPRIITSPQKIQTRKVATVWCRQQHSPKTVYATINRTVFWISSWIQINARFVNYIVTLNMWNGEKCWKSSPVFELSKNDFFFSGIHSLPQFDAFPDGTTVINLVVDGGSATNMGSFTRNIGAFTIHGCSLGAMLSSVSNSLEKRPTTFATGLLNSNFI